MDVRIFAGLGALLTIPSSLMASPCAQPAWQEIRNVEAAGAFSTPEGVEALDAYRACIESDAALPDASRDLHRLRLLEATLKQADYAQAQEDLTRLFESLGVLKLIEGEAEPADVLAAVAPSKMPMVAQVSHLAANLALSLRDSDTAAYFAEVAMAGFKPSRTYQSSYLEAQVTYFVALTRTQPEAALLGLVSVAEQTPSPVSAPAIAAALIRLSWLPESVERPEVSQVCGLPPEAEILGRHELNLACLRRAVEVLESNNLPADSARLLLEDTRFRMASQIMSAQDSSLPEVREGALHLSETLSDILNIPEDLRGERTLERQIANAYRLGHMLLFAGGDDWSAVLESAAEAGLLEKDASRLQAAEAVAEWMETGPLTIGLASYPLEASRQSTRAAAELVAASLNVEAAGSPEPYLSDGLYSLRRLRAYVPDLSDAVPVEHDAAGILQRYPAKSAARGQLSTEVQSKLSALEEGQPADITFLDLFELDRSVGDDANILVAGWTRCRAALLESSVARPSTALVHQSEEFYDNIWTGPRDDPHHRADYFRSFRWAQSLVDGALACPGSDALGRPAVDEK